MRRNRIWAPRLFAGILLSFLLLLPTGCSQGTDSTPPPSQQENLSELPSGEPSSVGAPVSGGLAPSQTDPSTPAPGSIPGGISVPSQEPETRSSGAPSEETPEPEQASGFSFWWLLLPVALLLLAAVGFVLLKKRKTPAPAAEPPVEEKKEEAPLIRTQQDPNGFSIQIGNMHHIGARDSQQDSFSISDITNPTLCQSRGVFAVVADGMGGLSNGAQISALVTSTMLRQFETGGSSGDTSMDLLNMVSAANREVNRYLSSGSREQSGSTVVAVLVKGDALQFISVGDSRIYLARGGSLTQLNREHTYASELDEKAALGEISLEAARSDPQRHALTSYIGMGQIEKIDRSLHPLPLVRGDRILLMSDGVFGTLSDREILSAVGGSAFEAAERLEQLVLAKHKPAQDNFTAVILHCV